MAADKHPSIQSRILRVAYQNIAQRPVGKPQHRRRGILHFYIRMVQIVPVAEQLLNRPHKPQQQIQLMRRLIDQHPAAFAAPGPTPRIAFVISLIPPAMHRHSPQDRLSKFAFVKGLADSSAWSIKAPL